MSPPDPDVVDTATPVGELTFTEASRELDAIVEFFDQRDVDVDQLVSRLERASAIVDELDRRIRRTRAQVEELVPRLEAVSRGEAPAAEELSEEDATPPRTPRGAGERGQGSGDRDRGDDSDQALF